MEMTWAQAQHVRVQACTRVRLRAVGAAEMPQHSSRARFTSHTQESGHYCRLHACDGQVQAKSTQSRVYKLLERCSWGWQQRLRRNTRKVFETYIPPRRIETDSPKILEHVSSEHSRSSFHTSAVKFDQNMANVCQEWEDLDQT